LFLEFAALPAEDMAILHFADRYGLLFRPDARAQIQSDPVDAWLRAIDRMCRNVELWEAIRENGRALRRLVVTEGDTVRVISNETFLGKVGVARFGMPSFAPSDLVGPAMTALCDEINSQVWHAGAGLTVQFDAAICTAKIVCRPDSLLGALWLQFAYAVANKQKAIKCETCARPFIVAPGAGRSDKKHCSPNCKTRAYLQRRDSARAMKSRGKSIKQIAERLGVDSASVKKWVSN
jgi:hypothetical protein